VRTRERGERREEGGRATPKKRSGLSRPQAGANSAFLRFRSRDPDLRKSLRPATPRPGLCHVGRKPEVGCTLWEGPRQRRTRRLSLLASLSLPLCCDGARFASSVWSGSVQRSTQPRRSLSPNLLSSKAFTLVRAARATPPSVASADLDWARPQPSPPLCLHESPHRRHATDRWRAHSAEAASAFAAAAHSGVSGRGTGPL